MHQLQIRYSGRVQGVGFRATVAGIARTLPVCGCVRNVSDGTVDLLAESEESVLLEFRDQISRALTRNIVSAHEQWREITTTQWKDFSIAADLIAR